MAMAGSDAQEIPDLVEGTTKSRRGRVALKSPHQSISVFDPAMIQLKSVVQMDVGPVPYRFAPLRADRRGVDVVAVARDPIGHHARDSSGRMAGTHEMRGKNGLGKV